MADLNIFSMKPDTTLKEGVSLFNKNFSEVQSAIAETVTKSEAIIPNNDSTININLSSPGWYRIATFNVGDDDDKIGAVCNSCKIIIRRQFSDTDNEYHELMFINTYGSSKLLSNADKSNVQLFTKIRHTIDSNENNNAFLEVYYTGGENDVNLLLSDSGFVYNNISYFWKLIQPEFTEEIVDGVTIYSSLDIPANSSGTATYDENGNNIVNTYATNNGSNAAGTWNIDITGKSDTIKTVQLTNTADLDALKDVEFTLYYAANGNTINKNPELKQGFLLKVHRVSGADIAQELISQAGNTYVRYLHGTTWTAFKRVAYTTDNVASATKLQTPRKINGVEFDGTSDINVVDNTAYQTVECKMAGVGWYRIMIGTNAFYHGVLNIARSWGTEWPESLTLDISRNAQSFTVSVLSHEGARKITKIRMVQPSSNPYGNKAYIDLYYNSTKAAILHMVVSDHKNARGFKINKELLTTDQTLNIVPDELEEGYTSTEIDISKQGSYFPKSKIDELTVGSITGVNYAGSSSVGGSANSADKLNTNAGSATQPVYFKDGVPVATTYTLGKSVPSNAVFTDTTYSNFVKSGSGAKAGLVPAPSTTAGTTKYLREDGTWVVPPNTTYSAMTAATSSAAGKAGLVPAPAAGKQASFLRGDGTWVVPTNTKYTHPSYTARTGKPTANQTPAFGGTATVSQITSDATGHVTAATDRTITIPNTLSNGTGTAGLIKTTSTVTSNSGYTACPVISGVPYYKDTDTKYTHPTTAGNKHIPAGGASGQVLGWSAAGTAAWTSEINAKKATQDGNGNNIAETYLPLSGGTLTGPLKIKGNASDNPLQLRGIIGSDGENNVDDLYLQFGANRKVILGNNGGYNISADGSQYTGTASKATQDGSGNVITSTYVVKNDPILMGGLKHGDASITSASVSSSSAILAGNSGSKAAGYWSLAIGNDAKATGNYSRAYGANSTATGNYSQAYGANSTATGTRSIAMMSYANAIGDSSISAGVGTETQNYQFAIGYQNNTSNTTATNAHGISSGTIFTIGNGTSDSKSNAFRVQGDGKVYAKGAYSATGADYAEYAEWADGNKNNEDRRGYFVTFDEENPTMVRKANAGEYILGIVSGNPCIIGNGDEDWRGRYILDEFGAFIEEQVEEEIDVLDHETGEFVKKTITVTKYKENPNYDSNQQYVTRAERKEWAAVGWIGVLSVRDDGTCKVGGYCKVADGGIATTAERGVDTYRVMERVTENIVKVVLK